ncbi:MAG: coiled-coil domain-containing protein [Caulobacteraceae bacterium]
MFTSRRQPLVFPPEPASEAPVADHGAIERAINLISPAEKPPAFRPLEPEPLVHTVYLSGGLPAEMDSGMDIAAPSPTKSEPRGAGRSAAAAPAFVRPDRAHYVLAVIASLAWVGGLAALALAFPQTTAPAFKGPVAAAAFLVLMAAPLALVWAAAFAVGEARRLLAETRRARAFTDELVAPTAAAAATVGGLVESLRGEIAEASRVASLAGEKLAALREALGHETELLASATSNTDHTAGKLVVSLSNQRAELNTLATTLDARAAAVADAINRQAAMVGDASDLAESQLAESQASLAARSADLAVIAARATEVSRIAGEDLARQAGRLESAGTGVGDQLRALEEGLTSQRAALVTLAHGLRADQEEFASLAETRSAQLSAVIAAAGRETKSLNETAADGARSVGRIIDQAAGRFTELAAAAGEEKQRFEAASAGAVDSLEAAGARQRQALADELEKTLAALSDAARRTGEAAEAQATAAPARVEELDAAALAAGQSAEQALDKRLAEARSLIDSSARLIDEAAERTSAKLEEGFAGARRALGELGAMADEALAAARLLPVEAGERGEAVRASLAKAMEDLLATARRTGEETQAIDASFQERVRRNYEMLSEAVQLMGVVAQAGHGAAPIHRARENVSSPNAAGIGLRPRLKLTAPAVEDADPPAVEAAGKWKWTGLLGGAGGEDAGRTSGENTSPFNEIAAMGIDPAALLSRGRIEEIAAAIQAGDGPGAREVVRTLAPAATRRLSRRIIGDADFGAMSQGFVARYSGRLKAAVKADPEGYQTASLLASDLGRAFLLLDASSLSAG